MFRKTSTVDSADDDRQTRGISSARLRELCEAVDREEALAKLAEPMELTPREAANRWRGFAMEERLIQRAATGAAPKPKRGVLEVLKVLLGVRHAPADPPKPSTRKHKTFFTFE